MRKFWHEMRRLMSSLLISRDLLLENSQKGGSSEERYERKESVSIKVRAERCSDQPGFTERIESNPSQCYSNSRVSSRRFSSTHVMSVRNVQPFDLSRMHSSAVIPAWGLGRPGINLFSVNGDIHRVFGANLLNLIPADSDFAKWVGNCDAFIKESDLWTDKCEVKKKADKQRPTQGCDEAFGSLHKETLRGQTRSEKIDGTGEEVATSRTVTLRIRHTSSLSRKVVR